MRRALLSVFMCLGLVAADVPAAEPVPTGSFAFSFTVSLPADAPTTWEAATGDISGWWDHSMSDDPYALEIQPRPGGFFLETFDASGDGVAHAVVTYADREEKLRMEGPMGLAGFAIHMVTTWTFTPGDESGTTDLTVEVRATGEVREGWPEVVESTWRRFIEDRLHGHLSGSPVN